MFNILKTQQRLISSFDLRGNNNKTVLLPSLRDPSKSRSHWLERILIATPPSKRSVAVKFDSWVAEIVSTWQHHLQRNFIAVFF